MYFALSDNISIDTESKSIYHKHSASTTGRIITEKQFNNRMIPCKTMVRYGFKTLDSEWWHFTLKDEPFPDSYFTFPAKQL